MKITLIGSGNVADVLADALFTAGHTIDTICSRNKKTGKSLSKKYTARFISSVDLLSDNSDLYIIATGDQSIPEVAAKIPFLNRTVVHTSGATSIDCLKIFKNHGVFYPVNSLTAGSKLPAGTPFALEASETKTLQRLKVTAKEIGGVPIVLNSTKRLAVHVSCVYANNFANALYETAYQILQTDKIPFSILYPLMSTTIEKSMSRRPLKVQTGPAVRNDRTTIKKHIAFLKKNHGDPRVYRLLSDLIVSQQKSAV